MEQVDAWRASFRSDSGVECRRVWIVESSQFEASHVEVLLQQSSCQGGLLADVPLHFQPLFSFPLIRQHVRSS